MAECQPDNNNSTSTNIRPKRSSRSTQRSDYVYPSAFHNLPVEGKKAKDAQKKIKQRKMKAAPEHLNWDYKFVKPQDANTSAHSEPCDVQFYTEHADEWKTECMSYYGEELKKSVLLKQICGGDQLIVDEHVHMNFYNTGIVLVQGKNFVSWGQNEFCTLQSRLNAKRKAAETEHGTPQHATPQLSEVHTTPRSATQPLQSPILVSTPVKLLQNLRNVLVSTPGKLLQSLRNAHEVSATGNIMLDLLHDTTFSTNEMDSLNTSVDTSVDQVLDDISCNPASDEDSDSDIDKNGDAENCQEVDISDTLPADSEISFKQRDIDSLLASKTPTREDEENSLRASLEKARSESVTLDAALQHEKERVMQLKQDAKLKKSDLADKDDAIKRLEKQLRCLEQDSFKYKKDLAKSTKKREEQQKLVFEERKQKERLDNENIALRAENRQLRAQAEQLADELAISVAKCESMTAEAPATRPKSPWVSLHPSLSSAKGARPKQPLTTASTPRSQKKSQSARRSTSPKVTKSLSSNQKKTVSHSTKTKVTVIGASNTRNLSAGLQNTKTDAVVYVNPGCKFQDLEKRVSRMITKDTDIAVLHLGTNDALSNTSEAQCLLQCNISLSKIEDAHKKSHPQVPLLVCSVPPTDNRNGQRRVDMMNDLLWSKCQKSQTLHFLDTGLSINEIGRDGVHLTSQGKAQLAKAITTGVQDFGLSIRNLHK